MAEILRPLPLPTDITAPYWQAAKEGALSIQHCQECQRWQFFPRPFCAHCSGENLLWQKTSGLGKVYTFTINRRAPNAFMKTRLPYAVAIIELDEGTRMMANIVNSDFEAIAIGARVKVCFERASDEITLPQFELFN